MSWCAVLLEDEVVRHKTVAILDQFRQQVVSVIVCINLCQAIGLVTLIIG